MEEENLRNEKRNVSSNFTTTSSASTSRILSVGVIGNDRWFRCFSIFVFSVVRIKISEGKTKSSTRRSSTSILLRIVFARRNEKVLSVFGTRRIAARLRKGDDGEIERPRDGWTFRSLTHSVENLFERRQTTFDRLHQFRRQRFVRTVIDRRIDLNRWNIDQFVRGGWTRFLRFVTEHDLAAFVLRIDRSMRSETGEKRFSLPDSSALCWTTADFAIDSAYWSVRCHRFVRLSPCLSHRLFSLKRSIVCLLNAK